MSTAVFTGKVLEINHPSPPVLVPSTDNTGRVNANRRTAAPITPQSPLRVVRLSVGAVLTGVDASKKEIEILTGYGSGDCGYQFQVGIEYVIYAYKNSGERLETGICTRTRPLAEAAEDVHYIREMSSALETGELRVRTAFPGIPGQSGATILAERQGQRDAVVANGVGEAVFTGLRPGEYTIRIASDGDLPDDPKVQLHAKGCLDVSLFRALRITGRVITRSGVPASHINVQFRSIDNKFSDGSSMVTDADGHYELRILRPGEYHLGINLNQTATRYSPYPRWFHPGTEDPAAATNIDFSGKPEMRVYDLTLPDPLLERTVDGVVVRADGHPAVRSVVTAFDAFRNAVAQAFADPSGHFVMHIFVEIPYQLHAVMPGPEAVSAPPVDIQPGSNPLSLHLTLSEILRRRQQAGYVWSFRNRSAVRLVKMTDKPVARPSLSTATLDQPEAAPDGAPLAQITILLAEDADAARKLISTCRALNDQATAEEILHFLERRLAALRRRPPIDNWKEHLLAEVPRYFAPGAPGMELERYRLERLR